MDAPVAGLMIAKASDLSIAVLGYRDHADEVNVTDEERWHRKEGG